MVRRKSDASKPVKDCEHHREAEHERANQYEHELRQVEDPGHDPLARCWCCCDDCPDLTWYNKPRKGVWWDRSPSGELQLKRATYAESPGLPATSPSLSRKSSTPPEPY